MMKLDPERVLKYIGERWPEHVEIAMLNVAIQVMSEQQEQVVSPTDTISEIDEDNPDPQE